MIVFLASAVIIPTNTKQYAHYPESKTIEMKKYQNEQCLSLGYKWYICRSSWGSWGPSQISSAPFSPLCQGSHLLPVGCIVIVGNQAYHCCVVSKLDDWVGDMRMRHFHGWTGNTGGSWSRTPVGPPCWGLAWRRCCCLPLLPGVSQSGNLGLSCTGRDSDPVPWA